MEIDDDDEDDDGGDDSDFNILTCIKDVTFTAKGQQKSFKLVHPPYIMEKWSVGIEKDMQIECTVNFEVSFCEIFFFQSPEWKVF
jgi:hypothetical protein